MVVRNIPVGTAVLMDLVWTMDAEADTIVGPSIPVGRPPGVKAGMSILLWMLEVATAFDGSNKIDDLFAGREELKFGSTAVALEIAGIRRLLAF